MRDIDSGFLDAMREKLEHGRRKGMVGWDQHWVGCTYPEPVISGPQGCFVKRLQEEFLELVLAIASGNKARIRLEAADVANFAMMIADIEGALESTESADLPRAGE